MTEELKPCPFCGSAPVFTGNVLDWKDDCRYVELTIECCASITRGIGWKKARDMSIPEREAALRSELTEAWNLRDPAQPEPAAPTVVEPEPVAYRCWHREATHCFCLSSELPTEFRSDTGERDDYFGGKVEALYLATPPRAALTDEGIDLITCKNWGGNLPGAMIDAFREYARAVIAADRRAAQ